MSRKSFGPKTLPDEVVEGRNLAGYEIIITGGETGFGFYAAQSLAKANARVIIATHNMVKGKVAAGDIKRATGKDVEVERLDLASLKSVRAFVDRFLAKKRHLNVLINNSETVKRGMRQNDLERSEDGFEINLAINHLGHFELFRGLLPALKEGARKSGRNSRVLSITALIHATGQIDFDDINFEKRPYNKWLAHSQTKTANCLFAVGVTNRYNKDGVYGYAVNPGEIVNHILDVLTVEECHAFKAIDEQENCLIPLELRKTFEQGGSTLVWGAIAPEIENKGGLYLDNCGVGENKPNEEIVKSFCGYSKHAFDANDAEKLWALSEKLVSRK